MTPEFIFLLGGGVFMTFLLGAAAILLFRQRPGEGRTFRPDSVPPLDSEALSNLVIEKKVSKEPTNKENASQSDRPPEFSSKIPVAILKAEKGENKGRSWLLRYAATTTIGRFDDCDIAINDHDVSRLHAQITHRIEAASAHEFSIFDYSSTNGTIVNGQPINAVASLQDGDQIQIGNTEFTFHRVQPKTA